MAADIHSRVTAVKARVKRALRAVQKPGGASVSARAELTAAMAEAVEASKAMVEAVQKLKSGT